MHLANENFSSLLISSKPLFFGSYKMNLKAFLMQYFTSSSFVFFSLLNFSNKSRTVSFFNAVGKRDSNLSCSCTLGRWALSTKKRIISLRDGISTPWCPCLGGLFRRLRKGRSIEYNLSYLCYFRGLAVAVAALARAKTH